jgi:energy-coupling factor transporter ATP-binding protein EcfA2
MNNNDIFKKLRVALQLRDDQIIEIVNLVNFRISKGELADIFRSEDHPNYMECGDQLLRNFLNGLIIHLRGTKEDPKNPREVLNEIAKNKTSLVKEDKKPDFKKEGDKKQFKTKGTPTKKTFGQGKPSDKKQKPENPVERFKFNSGKAKK